MKNILVYGLAGWEPEKEARVVLNAIRNLGYRSIFLCDKPNEVMKLADYAEVNPLWDFLGSEVWPMVVILFVLY